jgi:hypothetical protein
MDRSTHVSDTPPDAGYFAGALARAVRVADVEFAIGAKRVGPLWRPLEGPGSRSVALSSLKGLDLSSCAAPRLVDLFSFVLRRFWAAPIAASGSRIGPVGPTASAAAGP